MEIEMAGLIVDTLKLEVAPTEIDPSAPLFGEGLGLDSIDLLEIALAVSRKYGVDLRSGDRAAFGSLHALAAHIDRHRVR
ncbi:phosphopantetheine-binding protein [Nitrospira sp. KM1]|uniref:phosphopantetheine-binding protein n=1 Tax=Nitrospira sp. KM1 TaxID=1936990 RepID=UPI0015645AD3